MKETQADKDLKKLYVEAVGLEDEEDWNYDTNAGESEEGFDPDMDTSGEGLEEKYSQRDITDDNPYGSDPADIVDNIINTVSEITDVKILIQIEAYVEKISGKDLSISVPGV